MIRRLIDILVTAMLLVALHACGLEETFEPELSFKGESLVTFQADFRPLTPALDTKTPGDRIKHIYDINVVVYHADGTFHSHEYLTSDNFTQTELTSDKAALKTNESKYWRATFKKQIPVGNFKIYAAANLGRNLNITKESPMTEDELKSISLTWTSSVLEDSSVAEKDLPDNNVMFGFFTDSQSAEIPSEAPVISINDENEVLHAWVRRAASKVTVSFDGSELNEDVWLSFKSVQIKDIPKTCTLGKPNRPDSSDDLIADGEIIYFSSSDDIASWPYIAKGIPVFAGNEPEVAHSETAPALYFFENMQGVDAEDNTNKFQLDVDNDGVVDGKDELKDLKPYGTYVEVKAFYVNKSDNVSQGYITYRFMLGKNISNDFNAERNTHYKLTLKFKNDANDVDWHIDYVMDNPEISVARSLYISYLHRNSLEVPVAIRGGEVQSLTAEIIDNPWNYDTWLDENPDIKPYATTEDYNGFLSFKEPTANNDISMTAAEREADYNAGKTLNVDLSTGTVLENSAEMRFRIPVWTRALLLGHGFSGNNTFVHKERVAQVKFTAVIKTDDNATKTVSQTIEVRQAKRLVNPTGIWRKNGSDNPFNVILMTSVNETSFIPIISDGAWTASVVEGEEWVKIAKTEGELDSAPLNNVVTGSTGSQVDFFYKPVDGSASIARCGVVKILYHGNTCVHYIFLSQGNSSVTMTDRGTKWHMTNVNSQGVEESTPLAEGSMFRWMNYAAILASNNSRSGFGPYEVIQTWQDISGSKSFNVYDDGAYYTSAWPLTNDDENSDGARESEYRLRINDQTSWSNIMNGKGTPATVADWAALEELPRYYGVMYGDDSTAPKSNVDDVYKYLDSGDDKGMRGVFVWDRYTDGTGSGNGNHIFFPIGATGHGHRKQYDDKISGGYTKIGVLRYATTHLPLTASSNGHRPLLYNLYQCTGAIYWCNAWAGDANGTIANVESNTNAYDINYETYDFNEFGGNAMYQGWTSPSQSYITTTGTTHSSDACFIRCVD